MVFLLQLPYFLVMSPSWLLLCSHTFWRDQYKFSMFVTSFLFFLEIDSLFHFLFSKRENFRSNREHMGVQSQLHNLAVIVRTVDPKLHRHLEELDSGEYLFALRMVMVLFRRELSFVDALHLWEVMWAMEYNPIIFEFCEKSKSRSIASIDESFTSKFDKQLLKNCGTFERNTLKNNKKEQKYPLAVFLVASVLETKSKKLRKEAKGPDEVVEILSDVTTRLNVKRVVNDALKIHKKYLNKVKHS